MRIWFVSPRFAVEKTEKETYHFQLTIVTTRVTTCAVQTYFCYSLSDMLQGSIESHMLMESVVYYRNIRGNCHRYAVVRVQVVYKLSCPK